MKKALLKNLRLVVPFWGVGTVLVSCLITGVFSSFGVSAQQGQRNLSNLLATNVPNGFTVVSVGDMMLAYPGTQNPENKPLANVMRAADVTTGNFEGSILDSRKHRTPANITNHNTPVNSDLGVAKDLKEMGIKIVSHANNHITDWGIDGMRETDQWLDEGGLVHAGSGETKDLACAASYYETAQGIRVAFIGIASTIVEPEAVAQNPNGAIPGHPGVCPVRVMRGVYVTAEEMANLRRIPESYKKEGFSDGDIGLGQSDLRIGNWAGPPNLGPDDLLLFGQWFRVGDKRGFTWRMNPLDEKTVLQSIRTAKQNADFVMVMIHSHEAPADFLIKLAREAIDAGADEWLSSGTHAPLGMEIYKKRPIFYGLGSFFFEIDMARQPIPREMMEMRGIDPSQPQQAGRGGGDQLAYWGLMAQVRFENNEASDVRIYPVDLCLECRMDQRGFPRTPTPEVAQEILHEAQKYSPDTNIAIENNIGVVHIPSATAAVKQQKQ